jgi:hypothetical protein
LVDDLEKLMTDTSPDRTLTAGDTWSWTSSLADYPAPTWDATVYFESASGSLNSTATDAGSDHAFSIAAASTTALATGRYKWTIRVTDGSTVKAVASGWSTVKANPAVAGNDPRSWARKALEAVEAALLGKATADQLSFTIKDRQVTRYSFAELRQMRNDLREEVRTEEQGEAAGLGRNIKVRFQR